MVLDIIGSSNPKITGVFCWKIIIRSVLDGIGAKTYSNTTSSHLDPLYITSDGNLIALLARIRPIRVGEMDVTLRLFHHPFDAETTFTYDMGMVRVTYVHFHRYSVALEE